MKTIGEAMKVYIQENGYPAKIFDLDEKIKELEAVNCKDMTVLEFQIHDQEIRDAYFCRRRTWERILNFDLTCI